MQETMVTINNLNIISATDELNIIKFLKDLDYTALHCTNGTYTGKPEQIVPMALSGFKFITQRVAAAGGAFFIGVNSNASMAEIMDKKNASPEERNALEDERTRAWKIASPLAQMFPGRPIIVAFYDKLTPADLYNALAEEGLGMKSLHKWGYGTNPGAPRIEGAGNFKRVLAYPLLNNAKPACDHITAKEDQSKLVQVVELTKVTGLHGQPFISERGKVLFPVPVSLQNHAEKPQVSLGLGLPAPMVF
jgi:hypothetical protein